MKLRSLGTLLLLALLAASCASASKSFRKGQYDDAITRSIKVLQKEPTNSKHLSILSDAYRMATFNDQERILALQQTGRADMWGSVVTIYERMGNRNRRIEALPSSVKNAIDFTFKSYSDELADARHKAADYHYALGVQRLNIGTVAEARSAFNDFERVISYVGQDYRDVRNLRARAEEMGTVFVLFKLVNRSNPYGHPLHPEVVFNLTNIETQSLNNRRWIRYDIEPRRESYQFEVIYSLERIVVFPITASTRQTTESRTITEGTEFKTDSQGKPVLDSAGNFIRVPKTMTVRCTIVETIQEKRIMLEGNLTYYDAVNRRNIRVISVGQTASSHASTFSTVGDLRALSDQTRRRITAPFVPLLNDEAMIILASRDLGVQLRRALSDNSGLIR